MSSTPNGREATNLQATSKDDDGTTEYKLRKQLLLLAMLVVSMTYVAGLNPPGGVRQVDDEAAGMKAADPILRSTYPSRYLGFCYCNATSLAASLVVIFLLLMKKETRRSWPEHITVLRMVMVLDLFGLLGAYLAGSCREAMATVYASSLVLAISAYVGVHVLLDMPNAGMGPTDVVEAPEAAAAATGTSSSTATTPAAGIDPTADVVAAASEQQCSTRDVLDAPDRRKVVFTLATFTAAISYVAGLSPPGGFWADSSGGGKEGYRLGDSLVEKYHRAHFSMFFYSNSTAFVMSLFTMVLLLGKKVSTISRCFALLVFILSALLGLMAAYASGSCRDSLCTVSVVSIFAGVMAFIFLMMLLITLNRGPTPAAVQTPTSSISTCTRTPPPTPEEKEEEETAKEVKSLILLLANLVATITYQAGLNPPGGFWPDDHNRRDGHNMAGDSILMSKHPIRFKAFFFCNSVAFVVSLFTILMVQNGNLSRTLMLAMMLDMLALVGAYVAGTCQDTVATVIVLAVAGAVLACGLFSLRLEKKQMDGDLKLKKKRKRLLLLVILVATITYQVGLAPPAGFRQAGDAVLLHSYPRRYKAFFYFNTASFMASIALVVLLARIKISVLSQKLYDLYAFQVDGLLLGLIGAYVGGSAQSVRSSLCIFVAAVMVIVVIHLRQVDDDASASAGNPTEERTGSEARSVNAYYRDQVYGRRKYLMMLGILAASVTYQAAMTPPGGLWQEDDGRRQAGNPVLHDTDQRRYNIFFYSNSTSFVASVLVITLLLQQILRAQSKDANQRLLLLATNAVVVLDLLALFAAYASGSTREWENVVGIALLVGLLMAIHEALIFRFRKKFILATSCCCRHKPQTGELVQNSLPPNVSGLP